jgi:hypothetical protein
MSRRIFNLAATAVIVGGSVILTRPARAAAFTCTEEQWAVAAEIIDLICEGGAFTLTCRGDAITSLTLLACPVG